MWKLLLIDFTAHVREWERPKEGTGDEPMEKS